MPLTKFIALITLMPTKTHNRYGWLIKPKLKKFLYRYKKLLKDIDTIRYVL